MSDNRVPVCTVGHQTIYGSILERDSALLKDGDKLLYHGEEETVDYVWFYDEIIIKTKSGKTIIPKFDGDVKII